VGGRQLPHVLLPRLYAILDVDVVRARGREAAVVLGSWLDAGIRLVQLRAKALSFGPLLDLAGPLAIACRQAGAIFIVNDRADVARLSGADGVHLGQQDLSPDDARLLLPDAPWIGLSTHNDDELSGGLRSLATYLATGPVFSTGTKANPDPVIGLEGVRRAAGPVRTSGRPLVAIGGITVETAPAVIDAGADAVAVISGLLDGPDAAGSARAFLRALA
jgi:thiamine-phosphate pyrophosphorylase